MVVPVLRIRPGRERTLRHRHPWVYSGALADPGEAAGVVDLVDADGAFLARGWFNPGARIAVRVLSWRREPIDAAWWRARVEAAVARRRMLLDTVRGRACRLVHAEADGLPGLVVDRYEDVLVMQVQSAAADAAREAIVDALVELLEPACVLERSDAAARRREGLDAVHAVHHGERPDRVRVREGDFTFDVDVRHGQKTGFYLDQSDNRALVAPLARGRRVLDAFCYTGAFAVHALGGGAEHVTLVDSSYPALQAAQRHLERAGFGAARAELVRGDAFEILRVLAEEERRFGLIVVDPPKFATSARQVDAALRAYKDVNRVALECLEPGGILVTFSCSAAVDAAAFTRAVSWAAIDAGRELRIVRRLGQPADHPVLASLPESEYLCGIVAVADAAREA